MCFGPSPCSYLCFHICKIFFVLYVFHMYIWSPVNQALLARFSFSNRPATRPNISLGNHGNEPRGPHFFAILLTHSHTHFFLRSVPVCLWKVALKHTIYIHTVSMSLKACPSRGLFPDIVVFKWLFLLLLLLYWWVVVFLSFFFLLLFFFTWKGVKVVSFF